MASSGGFSTELEMLALNHAAPNIFGVNHVLELSPRLIRRLRSPDCSCRAIRLWAAWSCQPPHGLLLSEQTSDRQGAFAIVRRETTAIDIGRRDVLWFRRHMTSARDDHA
jgi:hypothetical protein